ncbi:MAG: hypothetical protein ACOYJ2_06755 [Rickettsiales bacterium]
MADPVRIPGLGSVTVTNENGVGQIKLEKTDGSTFTVNARPARSTTTDGVTAIYTDQKVIGVGEIYSRPVQDAVQGLVNNILTDDIVTPQEGLVAADKALEIIQALQTNMDGEYDETPNPSVRDARAPSESKKR